MMIWIVLFISALLIPVMMIGFGLLFMKKPPEKINGVYGYRTRLSMKNQEAWDFAHQYFGRLWYKCGIILLLATAITLLCLIGKGKDTMGSVLTVLITIQMVVLIGCIFPTERELRKRFGKS